jgi:uncharacterized membrane protein
VSNGNKNHAAMTSTIARYQFAASVSLIGLIILSVLWEAILAPLRPGGSWLVLKALPLLIPLFGILRGKRYTYQWASMFVMLYFTEGCVRAWSDKGFSQQLAYAEVILCVIFFVAAILFAKLTAPSRQPRS